MTTSSKDKNSTIDKKRLLELMLKKKGINKSSVDSGKDITPRKDNNHLILSSAQQRLWFLEEFTANTAAYVFCNKVDFYGEIDLNILSKSYQAIVNRHEIFRTCYKQDNGIPHQVIFSNIEIDIPLIDISSLNESDKKVKFEEISHSESTRPFDLETAPLMRMCVVKMSNKHHIVLQTIHHIVYDGWSLSVMYNELKVLYEAFLKNESNPLPLLEIQYADFALWQRNNLKSSVIQKQLEYWKNTLSGSLPVLELPIDKPRPANQSYAGSLFKINLSESLTESLRVLALKNDCTLSMVMLAAFKILLNRYTDETDILVGMPVANRNHQQTEELIGFFVNSLVLRTSLNFDPSVEELLKRVRSSSSNAYNNQDVPFDLIVDELQPERDLSHNPIFQVMFAFQNTPDLPERIGNADIELEVLDNDTSVFDITLNLHDSNNGIYGYFEYCKDLFEVDTINRMQKHYLTLLESMVANPKSRISQLHLISEREHLQLIYDWNKTASNSNHNDNQCVYELFEQTVSKQSDSIAIYHAENSLTYAELNAKANQLAHHLINKGIKPDDLVGICLERSFEMFISILAVLKAGGAYLPLDPSYPQERLLYMLDDSGASILITREDLLNVLPLHNTNIVCVDRDNNIIKEQPDSNVTPETTPKNLAYIIYTSGSTGKPKGVMVSHQNLVHSTLARIEYYDNRIERFLLLSSFAFDSSVAGIFWTLCDGGQLHLPEQGVEKDLTLVAKLLGESKISHILSLPSIYSLLLSIAKPEQLAHLNTVIVAGESCSSELVKQHNTVLPDVLLFNEYGPTEGSVWSTAYKITKDDTHRQVPIGKPIPNVRIYILDKYMNPVPIGIEGEIYIGGKGITRGYLHRNDLTNEKYITNPHTDINNDRIYKTGDLAKYTKDGNILFCGRTDHQVKIRGYRIELGEIESAILKVNRISEVVVLARDSIAKNNNGLITKQLVAYIVTDDLSPIEINTIRGLLKQSLPEYMIPQMFVFIDKIPLSPNGKVDLKALPDLNSNKSISSSNHAEAGNEVEKKLVDIWCSVLGLESVSINDNFFEIGGDSILSIQIIARTKDAGINLTPKQIFQNLTIAELARVAETEKSIQTEQGIVSGDIALIPIQHWLLERDLPSPNHWNQAALLKVPKDLDINILSKSFEYLLLHHDALRMRFQQTDNIWTQILPTSVNTPLITSYDLSGIVDCEKDFRLNDICTQVQSSLDINEGRLICCAYVETGSDSSLNKLCIAIHHLVVDTVSWGPIVEDLTKIYKSFKSNVEINLPAKTTSYKEWSRILYEYSKSDELKREIDYWLSLPHENIFDIPVDFNGYNNSELSQCSVLVSLSENETQVLLKEIPQVYNTKIDDILLTALTLTINEWTGYDSLSLGMEGHGREYISDNVDLSRTVGWFTSYFPISITLDSKNPRDAIRTVKDQLRQVPHHGIGFGILRYLSNDSGIAEKLKQRNKENILYNYLGQFTSNPDSESLFIMTNEKCGDDHDLSGARSHLLEIDSMIVNDRLILEWLYSSNVHKEQTIQVLADNFICTLRLLIKHCQTDDAGGYSISDFPELTLKQYELDDIISTLKLLDAPTTDSEREDNIDAIYPLSSMQEGMLFHSISETDSTAYFEQYTCTYTGVFEPDVFKASWQRVIDNNPILRTLVMWSADIQPLQVVRKHVNLKWIDEDWSNVSRDMHSDKLSQFLFHRRVKGFDFNQAPLMDMALIKISDKEYIFVWNFHHLLLDGWSGPLVFNQVYNAYKQLCTGIHSFELKPTPPYQNYISWIQQQDMSVVENYWKKYLSGFQSPISIDLGEDIQARNCNILPYDKASVNLTEFATSELQDLARNNHITLNTIIQGSWALLLSKYSREDDIVFGSTVSGRPSQLPGVGDIVGLFINTLPVRIKISDNINVFDWFKAIQSQELESREFEFSPLANIQKWSDLEPGQSLFESILVFENYPVVDDFISELSFNIDNITTHEETNYPLSIGVEVYDEMLLNCIYDTSKYSKEMVERMLLNFKNILDNIACNPIQKVKDISLLSESEKSNILFERNNTNREFDENSCVHTLVEITANKFQSAVAIREHEYKITYSELNRRANSLAAIFKDNGIASGHIVAVYLNRSCKLPVVLLAILKTGAAYLPLDPKTPDERINYIVNDADVPLLITENVLSDVKLCDGTKKIIVDEMWDSLDKPSPDITSEISSDDLAYVIYTSGSTGVPKGVEITHKSLHNLINWHKHTYKVTSSDRASLLAGLGFDASVWEIWPYLSSGATLYVPEDGTRLSPPDLLNWIATNHITMCFMPTPMVEAILLENLPEDISLRYLLTGGDKLHKTNASNIPFKLVNHYGPTENAVVSTAIEVNLIKSQNTLPSIGFPIDNIQTYILDSNKNLLPDGVPGELYVAGTGLARGYINNSELTASLFVEHSFTDGIVQRLYKTGDLVRSLTDGSISFLGRMDHQVKIHGYRIELGEIETVLSKQSGIKHAIVIAREDDPGAKKLVAYIIPDNKMMPSSSNLRDALKDFLPDYMVPTYYIQIDKLPITVNGKVDVKNLPKPDTKQLIINKDAILARNSSEKILSEIWCAVLRLDKVGIYDNFFDLGGDSILSIQIISRANQYDIHLTPKLLFKHPTIADLAAIANKESSSQAEQGLVSGDVFLTPIQKWFFEQNIESQHHWNQSYLLELPNDINKEDLHKSLVFLLEHHDALRMSYNNINGVWTQHNNTTVSVNLDEVDLSHFDGDTITEILELKCTEYQSQLNLETGTLVKTVLFDLGQKVPRRLLIAIHHLVIDGVSWRIFLDDLETVYNQVIAGDKPSLPDKTLSFKKWAELQNIYSQSDTLISESDYWTESKSELLTLPIDFNKKDGNTRDSENIISVSLTKEETNSLLKDVPSVYNTQINDVLLTALTQTFSAWAGNNELYLHMEGHGREELGEHLDISRTIGWFTALYPVVLKLEEPASIAKSFMSIKEQLRAIPNHGVGYGILRYLSNKDVSTELRNIPEPQVLFNYLGQYDQLFSENSLFQLAPESGGRTCDLLGNRKHLLEINAFIVDDKLSVEWSFSRNIYKNKTIDKLARSFIKNLQSIIEHCMLPESGGITPSDFPLSGLDIKQLDHLASLVLESDSDINLIEDIYPLSPMQEGMLYHSLLEPDSGYYFEQYQCLFKANIDAEIFKDAWQYVVDRNPILRTGFFWDGLKTNLQVVYSQREISFSYHDMSAYNSDDQDDKLNLILSEDKSLLFELDSAPLMRIKLLKLHYNTFKFIWSYHHLLLDGWSVPLLLNEVFTAYEMMCANTAVHIQPTRPYRNYIAWIFQQDKEKAKSFWEKRLSGYSVPNSLSAIEFNKAKEEEIFSETQLEISEELTEKLQLLSQKNNITLNSIFQAAWAIILNRYCGEENIVFGTTVAGRPPQINGIEEMIGIFINTLPMHIKINSEHTFLNLAKRIQDLQLEMRDYEYSSLVDIHSWSDVAQSVPLFESLFVFENYPSEESMHSELQMFDVSLFEKTNFPLNIIIQPDKQIQIDIGFDAARFDSVQVERLLGHIEELLISVTTNPDEKLCSLNIITEYESKLIEKWNSTDKEFEFNFIHHIVDKQAKSSSEKIAISYMEQSLSYDELNKQSNQFANYLIKSGIQNNQLVALYVDRSPNMLIAMLGILKSGAAYLPLDPDYPKERIDFILNDAKVSSLVTERNLEDNLPETNSSYIFLESFYSNISEYDEISPEIILTPQDIAYVIYTSGSTGKPKGVQVPHSSVSNFLESMAIAPGINQNDVLMAVTTLSFDIAVLELFLPIAVGARIILVDRFTASDGAALLTNIQNENVTIMQATPSTWRLMLSADWNPEMKLKVLCGGEAMPKDLAAELVLHASSVWNMYGPTETTVWSTVYQVQDSNQEILIGKPIHNTQIHILDSNFQPQPIGIAGEMYISGEGVTRGYLNRDTLTRERYIQNDKITGKLLRLYRTGDLVRYRSDGNIEYLNRLDNQIKIRGYRIELGEIENVLKEVDDINQAIVVARDDNDGDARLVAYYIAHDYNSISVTTLRKYLRSKLPYYMIPQHFVELNELPLTPNGKIDRLSLPVPFKLDSVEDNYVEPNTENEILLSEIWRNVLKIDKVSIHDNFFEIGGHSLLSVQVISKIREELGIKMELRAMVMDTLEQIASQFPESTIIKNSNKHDDARSFFAKLTNVIKTRFSNSK